MFGKFLFHSSDALYSRMLFNCMNSAESYELCLRIIKRNKVWLQCDTNYSQTALSVTITVERYFLRGVCARAEGQCRFSLYENKIISERISIHFLAKESSYYFYYYPCCIKYIEVYWLPRLPELSKITNAELFTIRKKKYSSFIYPV